MQIEELSIAGAWKINIPAFHDERGSFEVFWEGDELQQLGIGFAPSNAYHSYNRHPHTLRGIHFQKSPHGQSKLVSCVSGRVWDVMVDLRDTSATFGKWIAHELQAASGTSILIPAGCGHAFLTLEANTTIAYLIEGSYQPDAGRVLRWNDPHVGIAWPTDAVILSDKDAAAPDWDQCEF